MPTFPGPLELLVLCLLGAGALAFLAIPAVAIYFVVTTSKRMNTELAELQQELRHLQQQMQQQDSTNDSTNCNVKEPAGDNSNVNS